MCSSIKKLKGDLLHIPASLKNNNFLKMMCPLLHLSWPLHRCLCHPSQCTPQNSSSILSKPLLPLTSVYQHLFTHGFFCLLNNRSIKDFFIYGIKLLTLLMGTFECLFLNKSCQTFSEWSHVLGGWCHVSNSSDNVINLFSSSVYINITRRMYLQE